MGQEEEIQMTDNASLRPAQGSHWRHSNGNLYRVEEPANVDGDRPRYLEHVVYRNIHNGKLYTRELQDWHRSMTLATPPHTKP